MSKKATVLYYEWHYEQQKGSQCCEWQTALFKIFDYFPKWSYEFNESWQCPKVGCNVGIGIRYLPRGSKENVLSITFAGNLSVSTPIR